MRSYNSWGSFISTGLVFVAWQSGTNWKLHTCKGLCSPKKTTTTVKRNHIPVVMMDSVSLPQISSKNKPCTSRRNFLTWKGSQAKTAKKKKTHLDRDSCGNVTPSWFCPVVAHIMAKRKLISNTGAGFGVFFPATPVELASVNGVKICGGSHSLLEREENCSRNQDDQQVNPFSFFPSWGDWPEVNPAIPVHWWNPETLHGAPCVEATLICKEIFRRNPELPCPSASFYMVPWRAIFFCFSSVQQRRNGGTSHYRCI